MKKKGKKGPCWTGYQMVGMKKKGGRNVPNCVPNKKGKDQVNEEAIKKADRYDRLSIMYSI